MTTPRRTVRSCTRLTYARPALCLTLFLAMLIPAAPLLAQSAGGVTMTGRAEDLWQGQSRIFRAQFFEFEGTYHQLKHIDRGEKNSLPYTRADLVAPKLSMNWLARAPIGWVAQDKQLSPDKDDVAYALNVLPALKRGHFGHIYAATKVESISPTVHTVTGIELIDTAALERDRAASLRKVSLESSRLHQLNLSADQINNYLFRYRDMIVELQDGLPADPIVMVGFSEFEGRNPGVQARGPFHVAIIDRGRGTLEAISMKLVKPGLTERQFIMMLESRGKSKEEFSALIVEAVDSGLSIAERNRAIMRYLDDYDPKMLNNKQPEKKGPTGPSLASKDATGPTDGDGSEEPNPEPIATVASARPKPSLTTYRDDGTEGKWPASVEGDQDDSSIFDFGRE